MDSNPDFALRSCHDAKDKLYDELKRFRKLSQDTHDLLKAFTKYREDLERSLKSSRGLGETLANVARSYQTISHETKNLPNYLSYLSPSPFESNTLADDLTEASRQQQQLTENQNNCVSKVSLIISSLQEQAQNEGDLTVILENNIDDINNRYDWAIDRLKHYLEKEKRGTDKYQRAAQACVEKCQGIEERRMEIVAQLYHQHQLRSHQILKKTYLFFDYLKSNYEDFQNLLGSSQQKRDEYRDKKVGGLKNVRWVSDDTHFLKMDSLKTDYGLKGAGGGGGFETLESPRSNRPPPTPVKTADIVQEMGNDSVSIRAPLIENKPTKKKFRFGTKPPKPDYFIIGEPQNFSKMNKNDLANLGLPTELLNAASPPPARGPSPNSSPRGGPSGGSQIHPPVGGSQIHPPVGGSQIHSPAGGSQIHPPAAGGSQIHTPSGGNQIHAPPSFGQAAPIVSRSAGPAAPMPPGPRRGPSPAPDDAPPPLPRRQSFAPPPPPARKNSIYSSPPPTSVISPRPTPPTPTSSSPTTTTPTPAPAPRPTPTPPAPTPVVPPRPSTYDESAPDFSEPPKLREQPTIPSYGEAIEQAAPTPHFNPPRPPPPDPNVKLTKVKIARALYDSTADAEGELTLEEGQYLVVFDFSEKDWWHGTAKGLIGYFPTDYVEVVSPSEAPPNVLQQAILLQESDLND